MDLPTNDKIKAFSEDPANVERVLAMLRVGNDSGDNINHIIAVVSADILLRFHQLTPKPERN